MKDEVNMITGHYQSSGLSWDYGEMPTCDYCGTTKLPLLETNTSGVVVCKKPKCIMKHCNKEFSKISHIDDGKAKCETCEGVMEYDAETWDGGDCPECLALCDEEE